MKIHPLLPCCAALTLAFANVSATGTPNSTPPRTGVYDSRILSFAHFWSVPACEERSMLIAEAQAAKAAPDAARFKALNARLVASQKRSHLQVFSTAPADEAMTALAGKLPEIQRELGVAVLVSQWDEAALQGVTEAGRVDVTDRLVRELLPNPTEKQQKTIAELRKVKPLPLAEATRLADAGKL